MERTVIAKLGECREKEVKIEGWVDVARDQGKVAFLDVRDRSGKVQCVVFGKPDLLEVAKTLRSEWVVRVIGIVHARPEKMINEKAENGDIELEITSIDVLARAETLPFEKDAPLSLETLLDYRPLTLRRDHERAIFKIQHALVGAYREFLTREGFIEFQAPKFVGGDAEGGAEVFRVEYFNDQHAFLATSPQLYKQILAGVFERVFSTGTVFRAEKSATTRHLSEIAMLDLEMAFIEDHRDVMRMVNALMVFVTESVEKQCAKELALLDMPKVLAPQEFPIFTLKEVLEIVKHETGVDKTNEPDLEPEDERFICDYANKNLKSDYVFVTHYPTKKRPFYTYVDPEDNTVTRSFDLLFRGIEICSGAQRVHDYETLKARLLEKGLDPEKFSFYLQAFKFGMPPHGGIGMGLERLTAKFSGVSNVKEATLFPRDMNRIDTLITGKTEDI